MGDSSLLRCEESCYPRFTIVSGGDYSIISMLASRRVKLRLPSANKLSLARAMLKRLLGLAGTCLHRPCLLISSVSGTNCFTICLHLLASIAKQSVLKPGPFVSTIGFWAESDLQMGLIASKKLSRTLITVSIFLREGSCSHVPPLTHNLG